MRKFNITVNGVAYEVEVEEVENGVVSERNAVKAQLNENRSTAPATAGVEVKAPMPGTIVDIQVTEGQTVKKGTILCLLEAMKMENEIFAPVDGKVVSINVKKGDAVANEALLFVIG